MNHIKRTHIYKQNERYNIGLDVYLPEKTGKSMPVVIYIHGGALIFGSREDINEREIDAITGEGIAYISIDYRLAPETKLDDIIGDIEDAVQWVRVEGSRIYGFDASRVALLGKSAGGYLSLLCGTRKNRPNAIISFYGYGDILGDWYSRPSPHYLKSPLVSQDEADRCRISGVPANTGFEERWPLYLRARQTGMWAPLVSGYDPLEVNKALIPYCPIHNIDAQYPPTLLLHGSADTDVPVEQSKEMYAALTSMGVEAQLLILPNAEHSFDYSWHNIPEEFGKIIDFLTKVM